MHEHTNMSKLLKKLCERSQPAEMLWVIKKFIDWCNEIDTLSKYSLLLKHVL